MIYKAEEKFHSYYLGKCNHNLCAQKLNCQIDELASALTLTQALPLSLLPYYLTLLCTFLQQGHVFWTLFLHIFGLKQAQENHKNACRCGSSLGSKSSKRQGLKKQLLKEWNCFVWLSRNFLSYRRKALPRRWLSENFSIYWRKCSR